MALNTHPLIDIWQRLITEHEFQRMESNLEAAKASPKHRKIAEALEHLSETELEASTKDLATSYRLMDWPWVVNSTNTLLNAGNPTLASETSLLGLRALARAMMGQFTKAYEDIIQAIDQNPELGYSYAAMAVCKLGVSQPLDASNWLALARKGLGVHVSLCDMIEEATTESRVHHIASGADMLAILHQTNMLETIKHHPDFVGRYNFDVIEPLILDFKVNGSHKAQLCRENNIVYAQFMDDLWNRFWNWIPSAFFPSSPDLDSQAEFAQLIESATKLLRYGFNHDHPKALKELLKKHRVFHPRVAHSPLASLIIVASDRLQCWGNKEVLNVPQIGLSLVRGILDYFNHPLAFSSREAHVDTIDILINFIGLFVASCSLQTFRELESLGIRSFLQNLANLPYFGNDEARSLLGLVNLISCIDRKVCAVRHIELASAETKNHHFPLLFPSTQYFTPTVSSANKSDLDGAWHIFTSPEVWQSQEKVTIFKEEMARLLIEKKDKARSEADAFRTRFYDSIDLDAEAPKSGFTMTPTTYLLDLEFDVSKKTFSGRSMTPTINKLGEYVGLEEIKQGDGFGRYELPGGAVSMRWNDEDGNTIIFRGVRHAFGFGGVYGTAAHMVGSGEGKSTSEKEEVRWMGSWTMVKDPRPRSNENWTKICQTMELGNTFCAIDITLDEFEGDAEMAQTMLRLKWQLISRSATCFALVRPFLSRMESRSIRREYEQLVEENPDVQGQSVSVEELPEKMLRGTEDPEAYQLRRSLMRFYLGQLRRIQCKLLDHCSSKIEESTPQRSWLGIAKNPSQEESLATLTLFANLLNLSEWDYFQQINFYSVNDFLADIQKMASFFMHEEMGRIYGIPSSSAADSSQMDAPNNGKEDADGQASSGIMANVGASTYGMLKSALSGDWLWKWNRS